jgi:hypothetical protein
MRRALSRLFLILTPAIACAQHTPHGEESPTTSPKAWLGCWALQATSQARVTESDTVRLNGLVLPKREGRTWYQGLRVPARPQRDSMWISWSLSQAGDSAQIDVTALGGTIWRVAHDDDDRLTGNAYHTFDIVPGEHPAGRATGWRVKC